jgi:hypothetical protein
MCSVFEFKYHFQSMIVLPSNYWFQLEFRSVKPPVTNWKWYTVANIFWPFTVSINCSCFCKFLTFSPDLKKGFSTNRIIFEKKTISKLWFYFKCKHFLRYAQPLVQYWFFLENVVTLHLYRLIIFRKPLFCFHFTKEFEWKFYLSVQLKEYEKDP